MFRTVETKFVVISLILVDEPVISYLCFECECCCCCQGVEPIGEGRVCVLSSGMRPPRGVLEIYQSFGGGKWSRLLIPPSQGMYTRLHSLASQNTVLRESVDHSVETVRKLVADAGT